MFIIKVIIHFLIFITIVLPMILLGIVVLAPVVLCLDSRDTQLPRLFRWFDNGDGDGLTGDVMYMNSLTTRGINPIGFWAMYNWLAIRNPVDYFRRNVVGVNSKTLDASIYIETLDYQDCDITKRNMRLLGVSDYYSGGEVVINGQGITFEYLRIKPYRFLGKKYCMKLHLGWGYYRTLGSKCRPNAEFVFDFHPIKEYSGI